MALVASVSSSKGGSGKSTTSINLGVSLSSLGKEVTVIDANLSTPYLSMYLGAPHVPVTLHHVLSGSAHIKEATYKHSSGTNIIPGSIATHEGFEKLKLETLQDHIGHIKSDIIILDGAPGLDNEAKSAIKLSDEVLAVTTPELPSVAHSLKTIRMAERMEKRISGVVLTRAGHHTDIKIENVETILEHPVVGTIPEDEHMKLAVMRREPVATVFPRCPSAIAYHNLAAYLIGKKHMYQMENYSTGYGKSTKVLRWMLGMKD